MWHRLRGLQPARAEEGVSPRGGDRGEEGDGGMAGYERSGQTCISPAETKRTYSCKKQGPLVWSTRFLAVYSKGLAQCLLPMAHLGCHSRKRGSYQVVWTFSNQPFV